MGYDLGVDLGTTYTAAATRRDERVEIVPLGTRSPVVPSVVFLRSDGQLLVGVQELDCFLGLADGSLLTGKIAG